MGRRKGAHLCPHPARSSQPLGTEPGRLALVPRAEEAFARIESDPSLGDGWC